MRNIVIVLGIFGILSQSNARDIALEDLPKSQMILEAKHLYHSYTMLENKKIAWQKHQRKLINDFEQSNETKEHFGKDNVYGKRRLEKRRSDFYSSLQSESDGLEQRLSQTRKEIQRLKKRFAYLYARELTMEEIEGLKVSTVPHRKEKIRLLKAYIQSHKSWKTCLKKNASFDKERVKIENSAYMNEKKYQYLSMHLDEKVERNSIALNQYEQKRKNIAEAYKALTGETIKDTKTAKIILKHIKESD